MMWLFFRILVVKFPLKETERGHYAIPLFTDDDADAMTAETCKTTQKKRETGKNRPETIYRISELEKFGSSCPT